MYHSHSVTITKKVFAILLNALSDKMKEDWDNSKIPFPSYTERSQRALFFGTSKRTDLDENIPSLHYYMTKDENVANCLKFRSGKVELNPRYLLSRYSLFEKGASTISFDNAPYNQVYFIYLEHNTLEDFLESSYFEGKEDIVKEQKLIKNTPKGNWEEYKLCGLRISENRIICHELHIDFDTPNHQKMKVKFIADNGRTYLGTANYQYPFLEIRINRRHELSHEWMPFTLYFEVGKHPKNMDVMVGTHSGVGYKELKAIAGVSVLVKQEEYKELKPRLERFLFVSSHGVALNIRKSDLFPKEGNKNLLYTKTDYKNLEPFTGTHELFDIAGEKDRLLVSYKLQIDTNFSGTIFSPDPDYIYRVQFSAEHGANNIFMHIKQRNTRTDTEHLLFSNLVSVDISKPLAEYGETKLYAAFDCGVTRKGFCNFFPFLWVVNPPNPKEQIFKRNEIESIFFKDSERSELNKLIFTNYLKLERMRITKIEEAIEGISLP